jgi:hypothetical protein
MVISNKKIIPINSQREAGNILKKEMNDSSNVNNGSADLGSVGREGTIAMKLPAEEVKKFSGRLIRKKSISPPSSLGKSPKIGIIKFRPNQPNLSTGIANGLKQIQKLPDTLQIPKKKDLEKN